MFVGIMIIIVVLLIFLGGSRMHHFDNQHKKGESEDNPKEE